MHAGWIAFMMFVMTFNLHIRSKLTFHICHPSLGINQPTIQPLTGYQPHISSHSMRCDAMTGPICQGNDAGLASGVMALVRSILPAALGFGSTLVTARFGSGGLLLYIAGILYVGQCIFWPLLGCRREQRSAGGDMGIPYSKVHVEEDDYDYEEGNGDGGMDDGGDDNQGVQLLSSAAAAAAADVQADSQQEGAAGSPRGSPWSTADADCGTV